MLEPLKENSGGVRLANCLQRGIEKFVAMISKIGQDSTCEIYYPEVQRPRGTCPRSPTGKWQRQDSTPGGLVPESMGEQARKIGTRSGHRGTGETNKSPWVFFG